MFSLLFFSLQDNKQKQTNKTNFIYACHGFCFRFFELKLIPKVWLFCDSIDLYIYDG